MQRLYQLKLGARCSDALENVNCAVLPCCPAAVRNLLHEAAAQGDLAGTDVAGEQLIAATRATCGAARSGCATQQLSECPAVALAYEQVMRVRRDGKWVLGQAEMVRAHKLQTYSGHGPRRSSFHWHPAGTKSKEKGRALPFCRLGPDPALMPADNSRHVGQANAHARELCRRVEPLKAAKELVGI